MGSKEFTKLMTVAGFLLFGLSFSTLAMESTSTSTLSADILFNSKNATIKVAKANFYPAPRVLGYEVEAAQFVDFNQTNNQLDDEDPVPLPTPIDDSIKSCAGSGLPISYAEEGAVCCEGLELRDGYCRLPEGVTQEAASCVDSDGGNIGDVFGTVTGGSYGTIGYQHGTLADYCNPYSNAVVEYSCTGNYVQFHQIFCQLGCSDGACKTDKEISCTDNDGGWDYTEKSSIDLYQEGELVETKTDYCYTGGNTPVDYCNGDSCTINEYGCSEHGNESNLKRRCTAGCIDGRCVDTAAEYDAYLATLDDSDQDNDSDDTSDSTCEGPYHGLAPDGRCVWSCGLGTQPSTSGEYAGQCVCQDGHVENGEDQFGRRTCIAEQVDEDTSEPALVCHLNRNSSRYVQIRTSVAGFENGHSKHDKDFIKPEDDRSCMEIALAEGIFDDDEDDDQPVPLPTPVPDPIRPIADSGDSDDDTIAQLRERIRKLELRLSAAEREVANRERERFQEEDPEIVENVKGRIVLQVEENGEAWYVDDNTNKKFYLPDGDAAHRALQVFGLGISDEDIAKIPIANGRNLDLADSDGDSLPDDFEEALGTDKDNPDSDGDGYDDGTEVDNNYDPNGPNPLPIDQALIDRVAGKILIQVEKQGRAWYVNPEDGKRYHMKNGKVAYELMRKLSLGITNTDLSKIDVGDFETEANQ